MTFIKEEHILEAAEKINLLTDEELEQMSEKYTQKQALFLSYLLSAGLEFEDEEILSLIVYYFNIFFEAAHQQHVNLKIIDEDFIDEFEEEYFDVLEQYNHTEDDDLIKFFCNQPMMLDFLMAEILGEDDEGNVLSEGTQTHLFIVGVALIALMNRAIIK